MKNQLKIIDRFADRSIYGWYSEDGEPLEEHIDALEATSTRRLELLRRLKEQEGMIVFAAPGCGCEDCELVREVAKELADDND